MNKTPTTLIIMDGFGLSNDTVGNAVRAANTPVLDGLFAEYAHTTLRPPVLTWACPRARWATARSAIPTSAAAASCSRPAAHHPLDRGRYVL